MYSNGKCIVYDEEYEEKEKIKNPFEYYFEPRFNLETTKIIDFPIGSNHSSGPFNYGKYDHNNYKYVYKKIKDKFYNNYKIKDDISLFVNNFFVDNFKNTKVLGVHIRYNDHTDKKSIDYHIKRIRHVLSKNKIDKIFIASDTICCINDIIEAFKNIDIIYLKNIERVTSYNDNRGQHDRINTETEIHNNRKYHNYLCGKEAIMDVLLLAKCNYLLKSKSALTDAAIVLNENIEKVF